MRNAADDSLLKEEYDEYDAAIVDNACRKDYGQRRKVWTR